MSLSFIVIAAVWLLAIWKGYGQHHTPAETRRALLVSLGFIIWVAIDPSVGGCTLHNYGPGGCS